MTENDDMIEKRIIFHVILVAATASLAGAGCLERKETITITRAGAVTIELAYTGNVQDFETQDALPSEQSGWQVERTTALNEDGEERVILTSRRSFEPREALPSSFAPEGDPDADLYLSFPTTLRHERRADGVYLHFRRVYSSRPWAYVQYWQSGFAEHVKHMEEKPIDEMTREEKIEIAKGITAVELSKRVEFAQAALRRCDPGLPPDAWLRARSAMLEVGEQMDWGELVEGIGDLPDEERDAAFEQESERLLGRALDAFVNELAAAGYGGEELTRFRGAYEMAERQFSITENLGAHTFRIHVRMPGEIVAHNADGISDDGVAVWEFGGDAFRDRSYELMITSKLGGETVDR